MIIIINVYKVNIFIFSLPTFHIAGCQYLQGYKVLIKIKIKLIKMLTSTLTNVNDKKIVNICNYVKMFDLYKKNTII